MLSQAMYSPCPNFCLQQWPAVDVGKSAAAETKSFKIVMIMRESLEFGLLTAPPGFKQPLREP